MPLNWDASRQDAGDFSSHWSNFRFFSIHFSLVHKCTIQHKHTFLLITSLIQNQDFVEEVRESVLNRWWLVVDRTYFDLSVCLNEKKMNDHAMTIVIRKKKLILVEEEDDRRSMDRKVCVLLNVDKQCQLMLK